MPASPLPPTLYILCGLPFSGKSSLGRAIAARTGSAIVGCDDLYRAHADELARAGDNLAVWQAVRDLAGEQIAAHLRRGVSVVYDNTNFRAAHREAARAVAANAGGRAVVVHVNTPVEVIAARRATNARTGERADITDADLAYVLGEWESPHEDEGVVEFRPESDLTDWLDWLGDAGG